MTYLNEMTKEEHKILKGIAVTGMVLLHLFCRLGELPYTPLIWIKDTPLIYYIALYGDICVPVFAFLSGYAHYLQYENNTESYKKNLLKLPKFILNIWVVICIVSVLGLIFDQSHTIPGSLLLFVKNLLLLETYAGAWWYIDIYILLVIFSVILFRIVRKQNSFFSIIIFFGLYSITYLLRQKEVLHFNNYFIDWICNEVTLLGNTSFAYIIGMLYRKHKLTSKLKNMGSAVKGCLCILLVISFMFHCYFQSAVIAPVNAYILITCVTVLGLPQFIKNVFGFLGKHSTNIWLLHMFCYLYIFPGAVFKAQYPILIFIVTLGICIVFSAVINYILNMINNMIPKESV